VKKITKKDIHNVLDAFIGTIDKENLDLYKRLVGSRPNIKIKDYEDFHFLLVYPFEKFLKGMIQNTFGGCYADIEFILLNSQFIERQFIELIRKIEGSACCADKSKSIMKRLIRFFETGEEITWDYNAEFTYGMPKMIFTTHNEIITFYQSLVKLFYGDPTPYIKEYEKLSPAARESNLQPKLKEN
jgi:hypothetical protein